MEDYMKKLLLCGAIASLSLQLMGMEKGSGLYQQLVAQSNERQNQQQMAAQVREAAARFNCPVDMNIVQANKQEQQRQVEQRRAQRNLGALTMQSLRDLVNKQPHRARNILAQGEKTNPVGALMILEGTNNPGTSKIYEQLWKAFGGYTLTEENKKQIDAMPVSHVLARLSMAQYIRNLMLQKMKASEVFELAPGHLKTLEGLVQGYNEVNRRLINVTKEQHSAIQALPKKVIANCVISQDDQADKLLYVQVPATFGDNAKTVAKNVIGGAVVGASVVAGAAVVGSGSVNIGKQVVIAGGAAAVGVIKELAVPAIEEYIHETMHDKALFNQIRQEKFVQTAEISGPIDTVDNNTNFFDSTCLPVAVDMRVTYRRETLRRLQDTDRAVASVRQKIEDPIIQAATEGAMSVLTDKSKWLSPDTYTDGLDQSMMMKAAQVGAGVGAVAGAVYSAMHLGDKIVPPTAIVDINKPKGVDNYMEALRPPTQNK
jgi:hypothetical protein